MAEALHSTYDDLPYEGRYFTMTHPDRMATMARLHGMSPPPVETCRVLELGCADGGNLLPMAQTLPGARFVGIDLSPRQVADGRKMIDRLGFSNVDLKAMSILDVDDSFGVFDYIICHGVYSWVPPSVRDKILDLCARNLSPEGVAYVSYNAYPGWHLRGMVREMLVYHAKDFDDPAKRVLQCRALLNFLAESSAGGPHADTYKSVLKDEAELLSHESDTYIFHEHLEDVNHPLYFSEFIAKAAERGLRYLAAARFSARELALGPEAREMLDRLGSDRIRREQYLDFLTNATFRQTLLRHAGAACLDRPDAEATRALRAIALARPESESPDIASEAVESFHSITDQRATTNRPLLKGVLVGLFERWPRSATFEEVLSDVRQRLPGLAELAAEDEGRHKLAGALLQCHAMNLVGLQGHEPRIAFEPGDRPCGAPLARLQAEDSDKVTTLRHRPASLDDFDRQVFLLLDGTRDRPKIVERLCQLVADGALGLERDGHPLCDPERVREIVEEAIEESLRSLAHQALLMTD